MTGITRWSLRHKRLVAGFWLVLTILGIAFSKKATDALSQEYSIPGHQSYQTNTLITSWLSRNSLLEDPASRAQSQPVQAQYACPLSAQCCRMIPAACAPARKWTSLRS